MYVCIALVCILEAVKMHTMIKTILLVKKRTMAKTILTTKRTMMMEFPKRMVKKMKKEKKISARSEEGQHVCIVPTRSTSSSYLTLLHCNVHGTWTL